MKMAPTDNSPDQPTDGFELVSSLEAYNRIPVYEFRSRRSGLTIVIAEVEGPVVNGYFCLGTEAHDDDGLPHTLEHVIFLGSEQYPYKGVLDLLANRCLASGTNAWTDIDHTCYTMETAGSEGFLSLLPIFLEHILYPTLTDEGFLTEVHHITGKGEDAGVVYCEMQGRENSGESRVHLAMARAMYPGDCGYSSETGGIMKNLRESTNNEKVQAYHRAFYRPENLKVIITGQVRGEDVFAALRGLEEKMAARIPREPFTRPWQTPVPPLTEAIDQEVAYPCDEESNGIVSVGWRGPSAVSEQYKLNAAAILLKYLTDLSVSPLQREFVEVPAPFASKVGYNLYENSESVLYLLFENVPKEKLTQVRPMLEQILKRLLEQDGIDMARLRCVIHRHRLESLSNLENNPHQTLAFIIIGHMLYGRNEQDLRQRLDPVAELDRMEGEPRSFWLDLLRTYLVDAPSVCIRGIPSVSEQHRMAEEERLRLATQAEAFGEKGLEECGNKLNEAIAFNERPPPGEMLTSVPVPATDSINFHEITRYSSANSSPRLDLTSTPVFTYLDDVNTGFVYAFALLDTSGTDSTLRPYLPLLLEVLFESPVRRGDKLIPHEEAVAELEADTVATRHHIGLGATGRFRCGSYAHTACVMLQFEEAKFEKGLKWIRDLLFHTEFTPERLRVLAAKMHNHVAQVRRKAHKVAADMLRGLCYENDSNQCQNGMICQQAFLSTVLEKLDDEKGAQEVAEDVDRLRKYLVRPGNLALYLAANLRRLQRPAEAISSLILPEGASAERKPLHVTPDHHLLRPTPDDGSPRGLILGLGSTESSFLYHVTPSIKVYDDPDVPALMLYLQYITQLEGPLWKQVRGKGLTYGYNICLKANEGLLYLLFTKSTDVAAAFKEARDIVAAQLAAGANFDPTLLDSARSSLIFEIIDNEKSIGHVVEQSLISYFKNVDYSYNRWLVSYVGRVTPEDLDRVGRLYVSKLFRPELARTVVVCHPSKVEETAKSFTEMSFPLTPAGLSSGSAVLVPSST